MRRIRSHLNYANVMATIAVFLVLSGGTAVALSGSNTVFSDDIVNNQVYSADVRDDTLAAGGLSAVDLRPNSVRGSEVQNGSLSPADSSNVVARARGSSSISVGDSQQVSYPLSNNTWTQAANETDLFAVQITFDADADCNGLLGVQIFVDGEFQGSQQLAWGNGPFSGSRGFGLLNQANFENSQPLSLMFEPGSPSARTLTAQIFGSCPNAPPGSSITVTSLKINVVGFH